MATKVRISELPLVRGINDTDVIVINEQNVISSGITLLDFTTGFLAQDLQITGDATFHGEVEINNDLEVNGEASFNNIVTFEEPVVFKNTITIDNFTGVSLDDLGDVEITNPQHLDTLIYNAPFQRWENDGDTYLRDVVQDTTPQLGGPLDTNNQAIVSTNNQDIVFIADSSDYVFRGNAPACATVRIVSEYLFAHVDITVPQSSLLNGSYTLTLPQDAGTPGQVLATNGSGLLYWTTNNGSGGGGGGTGGGIDLTDLSVQELSPLGGGKLSYNPGNGVFYFNPADLASIVGIGYGDLSVTKLAPRSNGDLTYDESNGEFKFTPADLSDYIKDLSAEKIGELADVEDTGVQNGEALIFDATSRTYKPGIVSVFSAQLDDLDDVDVTGVTDGQVIIYDDASDTWIPGDILENIELDELVDVNAPSPGAGDVLVYDGSEWVAGTPGSNTISLDDLSDVTITAVDDGEIIVYDSVSDEWVNRPNQIPNAITFRGVCDLTLPISDSANDDVNSITLLSGDFFINLDSAAGAIHSDWVGLTGDAVGLEYVVFTPSDQWYILGTTGDLAGVQTVSSGNGVDVDNTDAQNPVVSLETVASVTPGTYEYAKTTVDQYGRVTDIELGEPVESITGSQGVFVNDTDKQNPIIGLEDTTVTPGDYVFANITVDDKGRITDAEDGDITLLLDDYARLDGADFYGEISVNDKRDADPANHVETFRVDLDGSITTGELNFPIIDGTLGQVLQTDGAGNIVFGEAGSSVHVSQLPPGYPNEGDLWFDSLFGILYIYYIDTDTEQWVSIGNNGGGGGGASVDIGPTPPSNPTEGDLWFDSLSGLLYIWYKDADSQHWVSIGTSGASVVTGTTPPSNPTDGDLWFNSSNGVLYIYYTDSNSSQWVGVGGEGGGSDFEITVGPAPHASPKTGDMWVTPVYDLYVFDGSWVELESGGGSDLDIPSLPSLP